jgi:hypothetical protein
LEAPVLSQVIVTDDKLKQKREKSAEQELRIDREGQFQRWRRNDITGKDMVATAIGFAALPVVGLWAFLTAMIAAMLTLCQYLFKVLGAAFGGKKPIA